MSIFIKAAFGDVIINQHNCLIYQDIMKFVCIED